MKNEQWIEAAMQSLKGQEMVEGNPFLHTRIMEKLAGDTKKLMPVRWMLALGSGLVLLCFLNLAVYTFKAKPATKPGIENIISEYGLGTNDIYLPSN